MSRIIRATVTSESKDNDNHMVKITAEKFFKDLEVESVNGIYLRKDDVVFVYIDDTMTMPLILGRATGQLELTELVNVINKLIDIVNDDKKAFEKHKHDVNPVQFYYVNASGTPTPCTPNPETPTILPKTEATQEKFADEMDNIEEDDLLKEQ